MDVLKLDKPIFFLDLETTGLDVNKDQIVEISIVKIFPGGKRETQTRRLKPEVPISPEAFEAHGKKEEDLADCPYFRQIAAGLLDFIDGLSVFGYNIRRFDIPLLYTEFQRAGLVWNLKDIEIVDVSVIFKRFEPRDLSNAVRFYCGKELDGAHGAEADNNACVDVFMAQIEKYPDLPNDLKSLARFTNYDKEVCDVIGGKFSLNADQEYIIEFGSHKGERAVDNLDFILWMTKVSNPPFSNDTLEICFKLLDDAGPKFNNAVIRKDK
jgi:DNA polymerase-3 subunit epsilon